MATELTKYQKLNHNLLRIRLKKKRMWGSSLWCRNHKNANNSTWTTESTTTSFPNWTNTLPSKFLKIPPMSQFPKYLRTTDLCDFDYTISWRSQNSMSKPFLKLAHYIKAPQTPNHICNWKHQIFPLQLEQTWINKCWFIKLWNNLNAN